MKLAEVEKGKLYRGETGYPLYGAKVKVIDGPGTERDLDPTSTWPSRTRGFLVEVIAVGYSSLARDVGHVSWINARKLVREWSDYDDQLEAERQELETRVAYLRRVVRDDRDITVNAAGIISTHNVDASERLLKRLEQTPVVTASGKVLTDADFERLADEAEQGR